MSADSAMWYTIGSMQHGRVSFTRGDAIVLGVIALAFVAWIGIRILADAIQHRN